MTFEWQITPQTAFGQLTQEYANAIRRGVRAIADRWAPVLEAEMKSRAPWQDLTGNARQSLYAEVEQTSLDMVTIILSHGVSYGIYLETMQAGRFSAITPILDEYAPQIWQDVVAMLR